MRLNVNSSYASFFFLSFPVFCLVLQSNYQNKQFLLKHPFVFMSFMMLITVFCLSAELNVFSGPEVFDQPFHSHPAGPHHCLPRT